MGCDSCGAGRGEVVPVSGTGSDQSGPYMFVAIGCGSTEVRCGGANP